MNEQELLLKQIELQVKEVVSKSQEGVATKAEIEKAVAEINASVKTLNSETVDQLKANIDAQNLLIGQLTEASKAQGLEMAKMKNGQDSVNEPLDLKKAIKTGIMQYKDTFLKEVSDTNGTRYSMLEWFKSGKGQSPVFNIENGSDIVKAATDMTTSAIAQSNVSALRLTELIAGVYGNPLALFPHVIDYFPTRNITRPSMSMLVAYDYTDGSGVKAEGVTSAQSSLLFKTVAFPAFAIYTYFTLTDEVLDDLDEALSEINRVAPDKAKSRLDEFVYRTTGDDVSSMKGMFVASKSTAFVPGSFAGTVAGANYIDVIEAMVSQCEDSDYVADTLMLNNKDVRLHFNSLKNQLDDSIGDNRLTWVNGKLVSVCGLAVKASSKITANTCAVGAIKQLALLGVRKNLTLEIGLNGTDFVEGQKTARVGMRVAFGVGDPLGIIYCSDLAAAKGTITAGA